MKSFIVATSFLSLFIFWLTGGYHFASILPETKEVFVRNQNGSSTPVAASSTKVNSTVDSSTLVSTPIVVVSHVPTPDHVKAIYMSSWVAGTPGVRARLIELIKTTELNAVVIDVKDNTGILSWDGRIRDLDTLIKELHDNNIYVIARIASFQDPNYVKLHPELAVKNVKTGGVWKDHKGVPWIDTGSHVMWDYLAQIGKDAHDRGFDELNFDYIRFPTDGDLKSMRFPVSGERGLTDKRGIVKEFYKFLHDTFSPLGIPISGDLFGIIATNANETKTLGQDLGDAMTYFNYVALMVYPSHFYPGTAGYKNPAEHPREIIEYSTLGAVNIANLTASSTRNASGTEQTLPSVFIAKLRPWYQDFNMGATYTKEMVRAQIEAGYKYNVDSWMLWDPANKYTPAALLKSTQTPAPIN